jgi:saccharopine dehydrogenase-like NADP-dependent oxidoreductase
MALTTGGMAALAARGIMSKKFENTGVFPVEKVIKTEPGLIDYFIEGLQNLGVKYSQTRRDM